MSSSLTPEENERLAELFERAADLPLDERVAFRERECGGNEPLRTELELLLATLEAEDALPELQASGARPIGPRAGTEIGPYRLLERIGVGGMGEVFAAEQQGPIVRRVAVKVIRPEVASAQVVGRFEAERQALARMAHANIAQVFDAGTTDDGLPYFVMELVEGEPIGVYCDQQRLPTRERLALFVAICEGVQHAHQKGIIHRDLKPSNLLVTREGDRAIPKIIDFGIARATEGEAAERTLQTMVGQIVGTLDYMSPEQADPTSLDVDTRTDVYSLGVVLYQLTSGLLPFGLAAAVDRPLSELQRTIREQDPPTPSTRLRRETATRERVAPLHGTDERSLVRQLAGDLDWICLKALEKDPTRRYASASELADDVRRHLGNEPVRAGRPGTLYRAHKFVRRNRVAVFAGVLVTIAAVVGVFGIVLGQLVARAQAPQVDAFRLQRLVAQADEEFWPPTPDKIGAMESWLGEAEDLDQRFENYDQLLTELREQALPWSATEQEAEREFRRTWNFESAEDASRHDVLAKLVTGLEEFRHAELGLLSPEGVSPAHGWSVPKRLAFARRFDAAGPAWGKLAEAWAEARAELPFARADLNADGELEEIYAGLDLSPQVGLVPLGPDPDSGLWEFWHVATGTEPARGADGRLAVDGESGIVLVLIPGGTFQMGAQAEDSKRPNYDPDSAEEYTYPLLFKREGPVHTVQVQPFFLSKYEMTQGQWERTRGSNPSMLQLDANLFPSPLNPVNRVSWDDCDKSMQRLGLGLPTEKEWEYAARAGTESVWWTGNEVATLQDKANLFDEASFQYFGIPLGPAVDGLDSDTSIIRGVLVDLPNPWGLHGVHGNVWEWCANRPYNYGVERGDPPSTRLMRVSRGGSKRTIPREARSAVRNVLTLVFTQSDLGLRPARSIED